MMPATISESLVIGMLALPVFAFFSLALPAWFGLRLGERFIATIVGSAFALAAAFALYLCALQILPGARPLIVHLGSWFNVGHHAFEWTLMADRLSLPLSAFSLGLCGLVGAFSNRYLHREPGYFRFYLMLALFGASVEVVLLSASLDNIFFGWELVGITSALLIAFFHERPAPVRHGFRAFVTYRVCDVGLLTAAVWLHHTGSTADLTPSSVTPWSGLPVPTQAIDATIVALLLVWASIGKAAQLPLGGWLPRAMEGPTPSSAIFYGAISIHLGPFLLLRARPILDASPVAAGCVIAIGLMTAIHATFVGRTQSDIKSALAYASMTQVGLIFVEIGLGLNFLAVAHIVGHASLRSLEILRSPSLLHDYHHLEQAMGRQLPRVGGHLERLVPKAWQPWLYRHALERGYFDGWLRELLLGPLLTFLSWLDALERALAFGVAGPREVPTQAPNSTLQRGR